MSLLWFVDKMQLKYHPPLAMTEFMFLRTFKQALYEGIKYIVDSMSSRLHYRQKHWFGRGGDRGHVSPAFPLSFDYVWRTPDFLFPLHPKQFLQNWASRVVYLMFCVSYGVFHVFLPKETEKNKFLPQMKGILSKNFLPSRARIQIHQTSFLEK